MKRNCLFVVLNLTFVFVLSSCMDFMKGSDLKEKIENKINYENSEAFRIKFFGENGKISPSGINSYKETDEIPMMFTPDDEYDFVRWDFFDSETEKN